MDTTRKPNVGVDDFMKSLKVNNITTKKKHKKHWIIQNWFTHFKWKRAYIIEFH